MNWQRLLGRSFDEVPCWRVVVEVLQELGVEGACEAVMRVGADGWVRLGDEQCAAERVGDVVLSEHAGDPHVSVLVDPAERRFLTSGVDCGVVTVAGWAIASQRGAFRRVELS